MSDIDLNDLYRELSADFAQPKKKEGRTPREERIIAGFEDIRHFFRTHGRLPQNRFDGEIFERLYAVRLAALRDSEECRMLLADLDEKQWLQQTACPSEERETLSEEALMAALSEDTGDTQNLTTLRHVRSNNEKQRQSSEKVADRKPCADFARFQPLFDAVQHDLQTGIRGTIGFGKDTKIVLGDWFILDGQTAYVAEEGADFDSPQGKKDARLRVIFSNGTESDLLRLSLARALYKDANARRIKLLAFDSGSLFSNIPDEDDCESGTIYVLRSLSNHPYIAEHRQLIHKIGVTGGKLDARIANARHDATFLLADVEVVAEYKLSNIHRHKLEKILHRVFAPAQLQLTIADRFGHPVQPQEWFLVHLKIIDQAVDAIMDGSITRLTYNPGSASLVAADAD